jgi:hypothetical protein
MPGRGATSSSVGYTFGLPNSQTTTMFSAGVAAVPGYAPGALPRMAGASIGGEAGVVTPLLAGLDQALQRRQRYRRGLHGRRQHRHRITQVEQGSGGESDGTAGGSYCTASPDDIASAGRSSASPPELGMEPSFGWQPATAEAEDRDCLNAANTLGQSQAPVSSTATGQVVFNNVRRSITATDARQLSNMPVFGQEGKGMQGTGLQAAAGNPSFSAPVLSPAQALKHTPRSSIRGLLGLDADVQPTAESRVATQNHAAQENAPTAAMPLDPAPVACDSGAESLVWHAAEVAECERDMRALRADLEQDNQPPCLAAALCNTTSADSRSDHTEVGSDGQKR